VQRWLPTIGNEGLSVYVYVAARANSKSGRGCFESVENMARALRLGVHTVRRTLRRLVTCGLLDCEQSRQHFPNVYRPVLPVPLPGLTKTEPLNGDSDLTKSEGLEHPDLTKSTRQGLRNRKTNRKVLTESVTQRVEDNAPALVTHLYDTLESMNHERPSNNYGRDGKLTKAKLAVHSPEHVRAKIDAFPNFWPSCWIARDNPGELPDPRSFWAVYDKIPTAQTAAPTGTRLRDLEGAK